MPYTVELKRSAEKELERLPEIMHDRIVENLLALEQDPRPRGVKKLKDQDTYRMRVGDYRVIYLIDDPAKRIDVVAIGHRREVYR